MELIIILIVVAAIWRFVWFFTTSVHGQYGEHNIEIDHENVERAKEYLTGLIKRL